MTQRIDLNCDMGESFGAWSMGDDAGVLRSVTSANIACGFHAGDPSTLQRTVGLAGAAGVAIGAHVSLPDLQGFGRREMAISSADAYALTVYQIGAIAAFAQAAGYRLHHVKPHGALYTIAARDRGLADAIAGAVRDVDAGLILYGLAASELPRAGERAGLAVAHEAFCDRRYEADGSLTPRARSDALVANVEAAVAQGVSIARGGGVRTRDGVTVDVRANTLCVHGDRADAADFAWRLRAALDEAGVTVCAAAVRAMP